jgi:hypothetical protein
MSISRENATDKIDLILSEVSFSRPANTTAYAAGDAVTDSTSAPTTIQFEGVNTQSIRIDSIAITSDNAVTAPALELWLFDSDPTATNDNSAFALTDADNNNVIGVVNFDNYGATNNWLLTSTGINITASLETTSLYGLLKVQSAYTPASGETFNLSLRGAIV